jgi:2,3,4,5-tetrahydropyridine-2,6-dicarboxylate N-succinyltransferase
MQTHLLETLIDAEYERRAELSPREVQPELEEALAQVLRHLNDGQLRVAEKIDGRWVTHEWIKKAILLYSWKDRARIGSTKSRYASISTRTRSFAAAVSVSSRPRSRASARSSGGTWCSCLHM